MRLHTDWRLAPKLVLISLAIACAAATLLSFLARLHWTLELLCHARLQLAWSLLLLGGLLLGVRSRIAAVVCFGLSGLNFAFIVPLYFGHTPPTKAVPEFRVGAINVLTENQDYGEVVEIIQRSEADVVVLTEVDQRWLKGIAEIENDLPHFAFQVDAPRHFGIAIYSRHPLKDYEFVELADHPISAAVATVELAGRDVTIIGAHPVPPIWAHRAALRNRQLQHLAQLAAEQTGPTILLGDLNITSWSPYFGDLLRTSGLVDTRRGFGILTSHAPAPLVRTPIDHILVSPDIRTHRRWVETCRGSDHDAVFADLSVE